MKQIFTLLASIAFLTSTAQYTENFETGLPSGCWMYSQIEHTTDANDVITGNGSFYTNPPTSGSSWRTLSTPFLNFSSATNISFNYMLSAKINANTSRIIEVGLADRNGVFTSLNTITLNNSIPKDVVQPYSITIPVTAGVYRLAIRIGGSTGAGNSRIIMDDLAVTATPFYTTAGNCNGSPVAVNDNFNAVTMMPFTGYVMTNDTDPNNEAISSYIVTQPDALKGSVTMNSTDGQFTFTPAPGFAGGAVTFTYNVIDKGYAALTSNRATVTINFPEIVVLPVHLISFSGGLVNGKAELRWSVAGNETGERFEIERSNDGKGFTTEGILFNTNKFSSENYTYNSTTTLTNAAYYRLKIINKDGSIDHSRTIVLKAQTTNATNSLVILQNPVEATLMFTYTSKAAGKATVNIYNAMGAKMITTIANFGSGTNSVSLNLDNKFNSGTYLLEVISGSERSISKLIKK